MSAKRAFPLAGIAATVVVILYAVGFSSNKTKHQNVDPISAFQSVPANRCPDTIDAGAVLLAMKAQLDTFKIVQYKEIQEAKKANTPGGFFRPVMTRDFALAADGRFHFTRVTYSLTRKGKTTQAQQVCINNGEIHARYDDDGVTLEPLDAVFYLNSTLVESYKFRTIMDHLRESTFEPGDLVGCKDYEGQQVIGFRRKLPDQDHGIVSNRAIEVWVGAESNLPVLVIITHVRTERMRRIPEARRRGPDVIVREFRLVMHDIRWNPDIKDQVFEIKLRPGATVNDPFHIAYRLGKSSSQGRNSGS